MVFYDLILYCLMILSVFQNSRKFFELHSQNEFQVLWFSRVAITDVLQQHAMFKASHPKEELQREQAAERI